MSLQDQFNYQILGNEQGPKLVFLHGLMGSLANWRKITTYFAEDYNILIYDQRGHGRSFHPTEGYRPEDYAGDLEAILEELDWKEIYLVGHSMGGRNAIQFASKNSSRIMRLVIEDIGPEIRNDAADHIASLLAKVPTPFESRNEARRFFKEDFPGMISNEPQPEILSQYFYTNIKETEGGRADWRFSKKGVMASLDEGHRKERWKEWESITCSTLLIRGEHSRELSQGEFEKMIERNSHVHPCVIEGAGHWVHNDKPDEFARVIREFF